MVHRQRGHGRSGFGRASRALNLRPDLLFSCGPLLQLGGSSCFSVEMLAPLPFVNVPSVDWSSMDEQQETTVVVADGHPQVREGIANLCAARGLRVVGQCGDGETALAMVKTLEPDFAILDVSMPGMGGIEVTRKLRSERCTSKLIILTISRKEAFVLEALRAGADAYLLKDGPPRHLFDAINFVRDGGVYISPLLGDVYEGKTPEDRLASLNPMEMEIFRYVVNGLRAKDMADRLDISPMTVNNHRTRLMRKLGVHDLVALVKFAIDRNLFGEGLAGVRSVIGPRLPHRPPRAASAEPPEDAS